MAFFVFPRGKVSYCQRPERKKISIHIGNNLQMKNDSFDVAISII